MAQLQLVLWKMVVPMTVVVPMKVLKKETWMSTYMEMKSTNTEMSRGKPFAVQSSCLGALRPLFQRAGGRPGPE